MRRTARRSGSGWIGWVGLGLVGAFVVLALATPYIRPYRASALSGNSLEAPGWQHLLGTNRIGQDLASQMLDGARSSLVVAAVAGIATVLLGSIAGLLAGWFGGWINTVIMRVVDFMLALPRLPLLIVVGAYAGRSLVNVALVIALIFWPGAARAVRSQVLTLRRRTHVRAAIGFGAGSLHVLRRHVVPDVSLILVAEILGAAGRAVLLEAGLAFLGIGDTSRMSWGSIMQAARETPGLFYGREWLWWMLPPMVAIVLVLVGMTFLGVAIEQRMNPRLARHSAVRAVAG